MEQAQLVDVICDTSFLIHIANTRIKNISNIETEIGSLNYVVPSVVLHELEKLVNDTDKGIRAKSTLDYIKNYKKIEISGNFADDAILDYLKNNGGIIATMDKELKNKAKSLGSSVLSIANDRILLEQ